MIQLGPLQMDEAETPQQPPELRLALAVVCAALYDVRKGARAKRKYEQDSTYEINQRQAEDARDFLLRRLDEDENHWGQQLRTYGMRPLTPARIALLIRHRPKRNGSLSMELLHGHPSTDAAPVRVVRSREGRSALAQAACAF